MKTLKNIFFVLPLLLVFNNTVQASLPEIEMISGDSVYVNADVMPEPVGGMESVAAKIVYPELAKRAGIEGKVFVSFVVNEKGKVESPSILKSDNDIFNATALETVTSIAFKPGKVKGKPVKVKVVFPIAYKLADKDKYPPNDEQPFPVGGMGSLMSKIVYPEEAKKNNVQGKVVMKAVIAEDGSIEKSEVIKSLGSGCDEAALKALKETKFTPAKKNGKPVRAEIAIPVMFKLQ
ncbi:MAG: energy transducer TonB [Ignavibacteriales bacterium]|nr:energy transducer TonB [Ignavibacteriales bacterium]